MNAQPAGLAGCAHVVVGSVLLRKPRKNPTIGSDFSNMRIEKKKCSPRPVSALVSGVKSRSFL
jgi:hypothetical protein